MRQAEVLERVGMGTAGDGRGIAGASADVSAGTGAAVMPRRRWGIILSGGEGRRRSLFADEGGGGQLVVEALQLEMK